MPQKAPRTVVISHWHKLIENFSYSPQEFYSSLEKALERRQIPRLELSRVNWREGGLFSADREYLRLTRERLVFDICAFPFGTGFAFSSRLGEIPLGINPLHVLVVLIVLGIFWNLLTSSLGFFWAVIILVGGTVFLIWFLRSALDQGLFDLDAVLLKTPVAGPLYEKFLRAMTWYRIDLIYAYQSAVHGAVLETLDEIIKVKGLKPLTEDERKPVMKALYWKK